MLDAAYPEEALLLARVARLLAVLAEGARTHRHRLASVRTVDLVAHAIRERREAHRFADGLRGGADRLDVSSRGTFERGRDHPFEAGLRNERAECLRTDGEPRGHGNSTREQLSEVRALAAELGGVRSPELRERAGVDRAQRSQASRIVTTPFEPSTRISCPVRISAVARPVPTTAGRPYSRQTIAA